jgi:hypothetical protein
MTHLVSIMQQTANDVDCTQPSPVQHCILMREESIFIGFTWTSYRFLCAYTGLLFDALIIALFACLRLKQNGNNIAMLTTSNHGQKD